METVYFSGSPQYVPYLMHTKKSVRYFLKTAPLNAVFQFGSESIHNVHSSNNTGIGQEVPLSTVARRCYRNKELTHAL
jgi:hypothetical protein